MIEVVFPCCAGLDVHKRFVVAAVYCWRDNAMQHCVKTFDTMTADLEALCAWLVAQGVTHVAMESTGVYWKPVFNILTAKLEVWIVNARDLRGVPGHKTDLKDAEWIGQLMQHGLLKRSFIPEVEQRDLRDLTRYRTRLTGERASAANRLQKILEDANIKLMAVASDIQGVSARSIIEALIRGDADPEALADLAKGRLRAKLPALEAALTGQVREHHRFVLHELLEHIDQLNERIAALNERIRQLTAPHEATVQRLCAIHGIKRYTAEVILAEIGPTVTAWPTAKHLAAWACLCPGNNITGGKRRSGKTRQGQRWLRAALVEAAWGAAHTQSYLGAQYWRLRSRRGEKRAAVAVAHSLVTIIYHLLANPEAVYQDLGADYFSKRNVEQEKRRAIKKLEALGFAVGLTPVLAAA